MAKRKYQRKKPLEGAEKSAAIKKQLKNTLVGTGKDILIGVIGGGIAGAVIGKPSFLIGAGVTGLGNYNKNSLMTTFGIGMMASAGINQAAPVNGMDGFSMAEIKARLLSFKDSFEQKLYLDKLFKPNTQNNANSGNNAKSVGDVAYHLQGNDMPQLDMSALDTIEQQVVQSGMDYQKKNQPSTSGIEGLESGFDSY